MENLNNDALKLFTPCVIYSSHRPYGHWMNNRRAEEAKKTAKALLQVAVFIAVVIGIILLLGSFKVAKAEDTETIGFPSFWKHDTALVTALQEKLVEYGEDKVKIDGVFGPKTAAAVKRLQKQYGMTVTGVVDDSFAWAFQVEGWPYNQGYTLYYMADLEAIYKKSDYEDLIYVSLGGRGYNPEDPENTGSHLWLYRNGVLIGDCPCITGNQAKGYYTPLGTRHICGRHEEEEGKYSKYYWMVHLNEKIFIHSLLEYFDTSRDHQILGAHISDGSIRIPKDFAEWIYTNEPDGVTVVIDDRAFSPYGAPGYEDLVDKEGKWDDYADWEDYDYDEAAG